MPIPTDQQIPPPLDPSKKWFNEDGTPTVAYAQYITKLNRFLKELRDYVDTL